MSLMYVAGKNPDDVASVVEQLEASGATTVKPVNPEWPKVEWSNESWRKAAIVQCDEVVFLPDYEASDYGKTEYQIALAHDKPVWFAHRDGLLWRLVFEEDSEFPNTMLRDARAPSKKLDHEGLHAEAPTTISTWRRKRIDLMAPSVADIDIEDIAHALARQCRYNGHVGNFLSVARHSIWVSNRLKSQGAELRLWGLLHDASEAYVGDMVKPLKHDPSMAAFRDAEERLERVIAQAFGLEFPMPDAVKEADRFVTVECELGIRLRDTHNTTYYDDEDEFIELYYELLTGSEMF